MIASLAASLLGASAFHLPLCAQAADARSDGGLRLRLDAAFAGIGASADDDECEDGDLMLAGAAALPKLALAAVPTARPKLAAADDAPFSRKLAQAAPGAKPEQSAAAAQSWEIAAGDKTLNAALARWAASAGWQLVWELPVDYAVVTRTTVRGSFEDAVALVAKSMESAEIPLRAIFYAGNKVLRIVPKGVEQ